MTFITVTRGACLALSAVALVACGGSKGSKLSVPSVVGQTETAAESSSRERLDAVAKTQDGFSLSRLDLEQRREGDVLGAAQAGRGSSLRLLQV